MKNTLKWTGLMVLAAAVIATAVPGMAEDKAIVVGGKNFTEQYILPAMAKMLLEKNGFKVNLKTGVGTNLARKSLVNDQFDLYYEYTGTAYTVFYKEKDPEIISDPQKVYAWVKEKDAQKDLIWLDPVKFNNTYTLMMRRGQAEKLGIVSISDLAEYVGGHPGELVFGMGAEFWERPDGFKGVMKAYDFNINLGNLKKMADGLTYKALKENLVDVAVGFATDGRISAFGFVTLEDDRNFFPVYNPAPVVRESVLKAHPEIRTILAPLAEKLGTRDMQRLNAAVDVEHQSEKKAAEAWLKEKGLL